MHISFFYSLTTAKIIWTYSENDTNETIRTITRAVIEQIDFLENVTDGQQMVGLITSSMFSSARGKTLRTLSFVCVIYGYGEQGFLGMFSKLQNKYIYEYIHALTGFPREKKLYYLKYGFSFQLNWYTFAVFFNSFSFLLLLLKGCSENCRLVFYIKIGPFGQF